MKGPGGLWALCSFCLPSRKVRKSCFPFRSHCLLNCVFFVILGASFNLKPRLFHYVPQTWHYETTIEEMTFDLFCQSFERESTAVCENVSIKCVSDVSKLPAASCIQCKDKRNVYFWLLILSREFGRWKVNNLAVERRDFLESPLPLTPEFIRNIRLLGRRPTTQTITDNLIRKYGTHFLLSATLGGKQTPKTCLNNNCVSKTCKSFGLNKYKDTHLQTGMLR